MSIPQTAISCFYFIQSLSLKSKAAQTSHDLSSFCHEWRSWRQSSADDIQLLLRFYSCGTTRWLWFKPVLSTWVVQAHQSALVWSMQQPLWTCLKRMVFNEALESFLISFGQFHWLISIFICPLYYKNGNCNAYQFFVKNLTHCWNYN